MQTQMFKSMPGSTLYYPRQDITAAYSHNNKFSYEANKSLKEDKIKLRNQVLYFIASRKYVGATCDEVEEYLGLSHQTTSARMVELKALDLIKEIGKRKTRSGRNAGVWGVK